MKLLAACIPPSLASFQCTFFESLALPFLRYAHSKYKICYVHAQLFEPVLESMISRKVGPILTYCHLLGGKCEWS